MTVHGRIGGKDAKVTRGEDRLLLDEMLHRVANEVAAALAALHLAARSRGAIPRRRMIARAIERLEGFGECSRILAAPMVGDLDAAQVVEAVCRALVRARATDGPARVLLNLHRAVVPGELARRAALVVHELVTNALKHAVASTGGELEIRLEMLSGDLVLSVIDDGPGLGTSKGSVTGGTRLGGGIVGELIRSVGGAIECDSGPAGTAIHVVLPHRGGLLAAPVP